LTVRAAAAVASLCLALCLAVACTGGTGGASPTARADATPGTDGLPATVKVGRITYDVSCTPVAETLIDIELPHAGEPKIRAITGLWDHQAVAVIANNPKDCGVWALGLARGLSPEAATEIRQEVSDGVTNFGVTASPVPREP
jgi:hypothetical protein